MVAMETVTIPRYLKKAAAFASILSLQHVECWPSVTKAENQQ